MTEFYPGSKQPVKYYSEEPPEEEFLRKPRTATLNGVELRFYTIGELADALNRKPVTIRKWESDGIIPKATFISPSGDKRGKRRLYTDAQIRGLVKIAKEEGIYEPNARGAWKSVNDTQFRAKAIDLFTKLAEEIKGN